MEDAVAFAFVNTEKGKICLLSTASPSYSVWKNFEEKGNLYKQAIYDIAESSLEK
jgi:UDP-N-acetylmuramoylalanine--D-glutamate ligase